NAYLVQADGAALLVDAGFSGKEMSERLDRLGSDLHRISALLITHEHVDHVRGAGVLARRYHLPVYATEGTFRHGRARMGVLSRTIEICGGTAFTVGPFQIQPFDISHDAAEPVGFVIDDGVCRIGICTDSGCVTHLMRSKLQNCRALVLETNHDSNMLLAGPYPWELKQRIRSRIGHLSNDDACRILQELWHPGLNHVFLAHLSRENNLPELARLAADEALVSAGCANGETRLHVTSQDRVSELIDL
ncbi:MBL fold metallo-hydrolase, partial [bacterium]|nr:MBL fold metallo-hydrolase [candidate division CSSED10-310 bacterium]